MKNFISEKNKKGFTLIELLAVLVVLAIIALIAIPIVVNIISDSRANSNRRSVDNYGKSIEYAVSRYMSSDSYDKDRMDEEISFDAVKGYLDYRGKKMSCSVQIKPGGGVRVTNCFIGNAKTCVLKEEVKKWKGNYDDCYVYETDAQIGTAGTVGTSGTSGRWGTYCPSTGGCYGTYFY